MDDSKTIIKYDARGKSFKAVTFFLIFLAFVLAVFGYFWIRSFII